MLTKVTFRATFITLCTMLSVGAYAIADAPRRVDIPAGELSVALLKLSKQFGADLVYRPEQVYGLKTHGAHGSLTTEQAVTQLLQGTVLELHTDQSGAMLIAPPTSGSSQATSSAPQASTAPPQDASDTSKEGKKSSSGQFRVAQVDQGKSTGASSVGNTTNSAESSNGQSAGLSEIIVTAQKKSERLQDVPVPVTVISAARLVDNNQLRLQDFYSSVPGLTISPTVVSQQQLTIRGITTGGFDTPTVGIVVDDVPYGSSTNNGGGGAPPDIDPGDLSRVEVLRGPQGTLYGASSMGGLLKFVTADPSTDELNGRVQVGTDSIHNGPGLGYNARASVNVPLSDRWAIRASAFTRQDPGYIDNVETGQRGVNEVRASGGRLASLWRLSDAVSLKLSALYQDIKADGSNAVGVQPGLGYSLTGDLQQSYVRGSGWSDKKAQVYAATLTAKLGSADLTAVSGYNISSFSNSDDFSVYFAPTTLQLFGVGGAPLVYDYKTNKFTQEVRVSVPIGQRIEWLLGAFYADEKSKFQDNVLAVDPATGREVTQWGTITGPTTYREYAGFTDLTVHFTDIFDVQVGGRESHIKQSFTQSTVGAYVGSPTIPIVIPEEDASANAFTYLVTPRLKVSSDLMLYARLASGYRAGGLNVIPANVPSGTVPLQYNPDKTKNYEIGVKGDFLAHALSIDASVFYIDWKNIQLQLESPAYSGYTVNGSRAKSQGVELSAESHPLSGLTVGGWITWTDAELTEALPAASPTFGVPGTRLPNSSRFSGNLSFEENVPLAGSVTGFVGGALNYVGEREGVFASRALLGAAQRQSFPAYAKTDLRVGMRYDSWMVSLFVANATDRRGLLSGGLGYAPSFAYYYIQPRTVGLNIVKNF